MYDIVIIGAGIVGLSSAYQLNRLFPQKKIAVLEKEGDVALHQSGHNSGVIHSGIYYKPQSSKAKNCLLGYKLLLEFCDQHEIPYRLIGKLIVATKESERIKLNEIYANGLANGLAIKKLNTAQAKELEPNVTCLEAIHVPQSGIISYPLVAQKIKEICTNAGIQFHFHKKIKSLASMPQAVQINCEDQSEYQTRFLINCAGLQSDRIARMCGLKTPFRIIPFKGNYYLLCEEKKDIVQSLIYPVPNPNFPFLGIHYTRLITGEQILGPNAVLAFDREGYENGSWAWSDVRDILNYSGFYKLVSKYWKVGLSEYFRNYSKSYFALKASEMTPGITPDDLTTQLSGIRAQVVDDKGNLVDDFLVLQDRRMIHICNAPSPAATAALSIGKQIAEMYARSI